MLASTSMETIVHARFLNGWESEQADLRLEGETLPPYELRYNFRLNDIASALGISQLSKLDAFIARRKALAAQYTDQLQGVQRITCPNQNVDNIFFRYLVALNDGNPIEYIKRFASAGIEVGRGVYPPLHRYYKEEPNNYSQAERAVSSLLSLPLYPSLVEKDIEHILNTSKQLFGDM